jgi:hypothetical protein
MTQVFLTIDTELSQPFPADWKENGLGVTFDRDIVGRTAAGDFGIGFQMDVLDRYGLRGVFFVDALCDRGMLAKIVGPIRERGHEVQLHLHTEWLGRRADSSLLPGRTGRHIHRFSLDEQTQLIARGIENLRACGVPAPIAFRAGSYGANLDTLRALARNGIRYDTSYNLGYLDESCALGALGPVWQPEHVEGVYEFPVTCFRDRPGSCRPLQLCACSTGETQAVLRQAHARGWHSVVLVSHSFELIRRAAEPERPATPNRLVIRRFERLCRFLGEHKDELPTAGFADVDPAAIPAEQPAGPLSSHLPRTLWRMVEQAVSTVF